MASLNIAHCTASFEVEPHYEAPGRLFYIRGKAQHPTLGELATLTGLLLRPRAAWRSAGGFAAMMNEESDELMHFSIEIFDNDTNIRPWLIDGGYRSGSGCWGKELNTGDIVFLQEIRVKGSFLRRGVGSWFLQKFLQSRHVTSHVFCWPAVVQAVSPVTDDIVVAFYHKNDFRRIGRTVFFCYSRDPDHPSRKLAIADDAAPLSKDFTNAPLSQAMEEECHLLLAIDSNKKPDIIKVIKDAYSVDHAVIHKKGPDGLTPTHLAALKQNVHALRTLLDLGVDDDLKDVKNMRGTTPLEALAEVMRSDRYRKEDMFIKWDGYSTEALTCEYLLKKALNMPLHATSESDYIFQYMCDFAEEHGDEEDFDYDSDF